MLNGLRLGRIAGIEIVADWSLLVIFFLVTMSLGAGVFPAWHPDWSNAQSLVTAAFAAVLFFASVLAHELAHALVGRANGMGISRITLFVFGGIAQLEREPDRWTTELKMAIVGPLTSIVLGLTLLALAVATAEFGARTPVSTADILAAMGPLATLLFWVGQINLMLALFNLVPGFPLDGGRVLRALLWGATGNLRRATRRASQAGQLFSWVLVLAGFGIMLGLQVPLLGRGLLPGLWLVFIGWFLHNAAVMSYRQLLIQEALEHVPVERIMHADFVSVPGAATVAELVENYVIPGRQRTFPVVEGDRFIGLVGLEDIRKAPRGAWDRTTAREVMTPAAAVSTVPPGESAAEAMIALGRRGVNQLPVVDKGRVRGLLSREDILRLLSIYGDPALAS
ncbi:MAG: site-2 protease family protein [Gammaproteobacteria bacterium]|nr:site-2 protease family protein [Gammaproteobacteria bacterium]